MRMSGEGENGGPEGATDVNSLLEEAKVAQAPIAPPKEVVAAGPMMQPEEEKKKDKETAEMAKPNRGDAWASGAFKRGVALQAVVVSFVVFLQFQPPEVQQLGICPPFVNKGCVGFVDWFLIVFTGAPIPPLY